MILHILGTLYCLFTLSNGLPTHSETIYKDIFNDQEKCPYISAMIKQSETLEPLKNCDDSTIFNITHLSDSTLNKARCILLYNTFLYCSSFYKSIEDKASIDVSPMENPTIISICDLLSSNLKQTNYSSGSNITFTLLKNPEQCHRLCADISGTVYPLCNYSAVLLGLKVKKHPQPIGNINDTTDELNNTRKQIQKTKPEIQQFVKSAILDNLNPKEVLPKAKNPNDDKAKSEGQVLNTATPIKDLDSHMEENTLLKPGSISKPEKHNQENQTNIKQPPVVSKEAIAQKDQDSHNKDKAEQNPNADEVTVPDDDKKKTDIEENYNPDNQDELNDAEKDTKIAPEKINGENEDQDDASNGYYLAELDHSEKNKPDKLEESVSIENDQSYFFSYFMTICVIFVLCYVGYHNKQKILALILEGRKGRRPSRTRRPNSANYHKLDSNLEEAVTSSCNKNTTQVIY